MARKSPEPRAHAFTVRELIVELSKCRDPMARVKVLTPADDQEGPGYPAVLVESRAGGVVLLKSAKKEA